ncbi:hypothetical protein AC579_351 [Pseudocercospora musae]|uniref:Uncharacterized protein n=1 Tax=Pseudocercospora musae TaxID=113226 RepID=A0A139IRH6_9PEZI|nr:hypothetical protein AC579_351 [Pseudocercospora musae]KXT17156.1 hypothetical protein AC579_351 [Pseudocercospora musae]
MLCVGLNRLWRQRPRTMFSAEDTIRQYRVGCCSASGEEHGRLPEASDSSTARRLAIDYQWHKAFRAPNTCYCREQGTHAVVTHGVVVPTEK